MAASVAEVDGKNLGLLLGVPVPVTLLPDHQPPILKRLGLTSDEWLAEGGHGI